MRTITAVVTISLFADRSEYFERFLVLYYILRRVSLNLIYCA